MSSLFFPRLLFLMTSCHRTGARKPGQGQPWSASDVLLFPLQLALRGPAGPMGLTGRPGPMVSDWQVCGTSTFDSSWEPAQTGGL